MKTLYLSAVMFAATIGYSMSPPTTRSIKPKIDVKYAVLIAEASAQKIDPAAYCGVVSLSEDYGPPFEGAATLTQTWRVVFYRPGSRIGDGGKRGFNDIVVLVSAEDGSARVTEK